ncbi:MAG: putative quinol monooxygenase [Dehalococcoidia bacterium]|nr:putative quinol monooxygenase [Dehalococcoidia bacterium]
MTAILAQFKIKPEMQAEAEKALAEMVAAVEANEPGAVLYVAHRSQKDPTLITFFEAYADHDAFTAHTQTPHFQNFQRQLAQLADLSTVRIERLERIAGFTR